MTSDRRLAELARAIDDADQSIEAHRRLLASWRVTFNGLRRELRRAIGKSKTIRVTERGARTVRGDKRTAKPGRRHSAPEKT